MPKAKKPAPMTPAELSRLMRASKVTCRSIARGLGMDRITLWKLTAGKIKIGFVRSLGLSMYFREFHALETKWRPMSDLQGKERIAS